MFADMTLHAEANRQSMSSSLARPFAEERDSWRIFSVHLHVIWVYIYIYNLRIVFALWEMYGANLVTRPDPKLELMP